MIKVLNIPIYEKDIPSAIQTICTDEIDNNAKPKLISATGAHGLVEAAYDANLKTILENFFWNLPDGMPVVWVGRWKGAKGVKRCYGPDFFKELVTESSAMDLKHFLCGGKEGVAAELKEVCARKFGNDKVVGTYCPPFREMTDTEMATLGQQIAGSGAQIIWIGLSTPKQEKFASRLAKYVTGGYIITVGAAFDFHTGRVKQAPKWMQSAGMEWLFRLWMEPGRLAKRYIRVVPLFIWLNIKEIVYLTLKAGSK